VAGLHTAIYTCMYVYRNIHTHMYICVHICMYMYYVYLNTGDAGVTMPASFAHGSTYI